jgi:hypothetical protein
MPYEDRPGAYWMLDLEHRHTAYEGARTPQLRHSEAAELFERSAV